MSNHAEFISEWNEIISYKIKESDLVKPTEEFLTNALINYLKMMNVDVGHLINQKNNEDQESRRLFKIKFCSYINYLYKISDKSNQFLFYDLIKPSPKKTAHMLKILLNYLLYYNMVKEEVISVAKEKIQERNEIKNLLNALLIENESNKVRAESIEETINDYHAQLPKLNDKIEKKTVENRNLLEKIKEIEESTKNYDNMVCQLRHNEEQLRSELVSEDEVESLLAVKEALKKSVIEQEEIEKSIMSSSQITTANIERLEKTLRTIENILVTYPLEDMFLATKKKNLIDDLKHKLNVQRTLNEKKATEIKSNLEKYEELQATYSSKSKELERMTEEYEKEISTLETNIEIQNKHVEVLQSKANDLCGLIAEEREFTEFIIEMADKLLKKLKDPNACI